MNEDKESKEIKQVKEQQAKWHIQIIFLYYASFGDRNNFKLLKQQNFRRFLIDSETVTAEQQFPYFDILFRKVDKNAVAFPQFLEMIPNMGQLVYQSQHLPRKGAFKKYLTQKIEPLYYNILKKSEFGQDLVILTETVVSNRNQAMLLDIPAMRKIYEQYILSTSMHQKLPVDTFQKIHIFLKQFQLSPQLVYRSLAYAIFVYILKIKEENLKFTYDDFTQFIIRVAEIGSKRTMCQGFSQINKIFRLLQRMQISGGFAKLSKKLPRDSSQVPTFFVSHVKQIQRNQNHDEQKDMQNNINKIWPSSTRHKKCNSQFQGNLSKRKDSRKQNYQTVQTIMQDQTMNFGRDLKQIKKVFQELCSYGQVGNTKTLKSIKIKKLFEKIGLLKLVTQQWLDIKMTNLSKNSNTGKIQFAQFLQLLSLTSKKLNTTFEELIQILFEFSSKETNDNMSRFSRIEVNHDITDLRHMLRLVERPLQKIFNHFASKEHVMDFDQLTKLAIEFEFFPQLISKTRLYQLFTLNSEQRKLENEIASLAQEPLISFSGFLDLLAFISCEISEQSLSHQQKIIILLQKMHESKGQRNVVIPRGSLVSQVRLRFANIYQTSFNKKQQSHVQDFNQLLGSVSF